MSSSPDSPPQSPILPVRLGLDDKFGFRLLKQVLFGEKTVPLRPDAAQKRIARYQERTARSAAGRADLLADTQDKIYESLGD